ncbi:MAG: PKD domain-containing protein [Candidatus Berkelbacteria bacterium]|nr:PKD domain-containing protein [Candidatus Berkelbacteria bacterium]
MATTSWVVSGAGNNDYNGTYTESGTYGSNNKAAYTNGAKWLFNDREDMTGQDLWCLDSSKYNVMETGKGDCAYASYSTDLPGSWFNANSSEPAPTVSAPASGITISGTCKQYDEATNCADSETVKVAVNGTLQAQTGATSSGAWSIAGVTASSSGDVITVFVDVAADANEANAVTKYDGTGDITDINLFERHLSIGSADNQTITNANLSQYDNSVSSDEDIFFEVDANNDLTIPATSTQTATDQIIIIKASNTYQPDSSSSGNVTTPNLAIPTSATLTADGNTITLTASGTPFVKTGTFTAGTSTFKYTGAGNTTVAAATYNNLETSPSGSASLPSSVSVTGAGTSAYNGVYAPNGTYGGVTAYNYSSYWIYAPGSYWYMSQTLGGTGGDVAYYSNANCENPWTLTWNVNTGDNPAPTVAETSSASTYTFASGTTNVNGAYTNGDGTHAVNTTADTNDPTLNIDGAYTNSASTTFVASASAAFSVASDYTNNGIFTDSAGTLTLDGQGLQTITANGTDASHDFKNLTITNASAAGVSFADSATVTGTFTDTTASSKVTFHSTSTYAFNAISINGQAIGTRVTLTSSTGASAWNLNVTEASPVASNVSVKDSNANKDINATTGGYDATGNTHWLFPATAPTVSSIDPTSGSIAGGTSVTITGTNFVAGYSDGTGGTITHDGLYTVHTFTTSGTFIAPANISAEVLVVAGGGGGGGSRGAGGGAGGLIYNASYAITAGNKTVTVGNGGDGGADSGAHGGSGENSVFNDQTAIGGGYGAGAASTSGDNGGSGGGAVAGGSIGTGSQGSDGGTGAGPSHYGGGGGGGSGGVGADGSSSGSAEAAGGIGIAKTISGSSVTYAAGGAGGHNDIRDQVGATGGANTGNGGGGGQNLTVAGAGGAGGSGIIIVRYLTPSPNNVTFGGVAATNIIVVNSTTITATTPAHAAGAVDVVVTNPDTTTGTLAGGYTYEVSGITISGSCKQSNGSSNCADSETVKVAVNGVLQAQTGTTSSGSWSISGVTTPSSGNIIVVYIDGVAAANKSTAVGKYDGSGDISGLTLTEGSVTLGSGDNQSISNSDYGSYDSTDDSDILFTLSGTTLSVLGNYKILSSNTYAPDGNTSVSGNWVNAGTFTKGSSTITFNGTAAQSITSASSAFNNITVSNTAGEVSQADAMTISGTLTTNSSTIYDINGQDISLVTLTNNGTFRLQGGETNFTITNKDTTHGTIEYDGAGTYTSLKYGNTYQNLTISGAGSFTEGANTTANGNFSISAGSYSTGASGYTLNCAGLAISGGTFTIPNASFATKVTATSFNQTGGVFSIGDYAYIDINGAFTKTTGTTTTGSQSRFYISGDISIAGASFGGSSTKIYMDGNTNSAIITAPTAIAGTLDFNKGATYTATLNTGVTIGSILVEGGLINTNSQTITMNVDSGTINAAGATINNLKISANPVYVTSNVTIDQTLVVDTSKSLSINSAAATVTFADTARLTLNGNLATVNTTVGTYLFQDDAATYIPTSGGSISGKIKLQVVTKNITVPARTYLGRVEINNAGATDRTATLGSAGSQTIIIGGSIYDSSYGSGLFVSADGNGNMAVDGSANNPTMNVTTYDATTTNGDMDFTGTGAGTESITAGSGNWTVKGDIDLTAGTLTAGSGTFTLNGTGANQTQTITSASQSFNNLTITNNATGGIIFADSATVAGTFTAATASTKLTFHAGSIYTLAAININGQASGTKVVMISSSNGSAYHFNVAAATPTVSYSNIRDADASGGSLINAYNGTNTNSTGNTNIVFSVPDAPTIGTPTRGNGQVSVTFTPPAYDGGGTITGYTVTSTPGSKTGTGAGSPIVVSGLTNGTTYTFTVHATNVAGNSSESSPSSEATPATVPGVPTVIVATAGNAQATISFSAPDTGGSPITGYTATSTPGGLTGSNITSPITVTGLTNGVEYTFKVYATNTIGNGSESSASNAVTPSLTFNISGSCKQYDESTNCADSETVKVAINSSLQAQTGTTSSGVWTISGVTAPSTGDIITVFADGATDEHEANAVAKYDGSGDTSGIALYERHLTIGSADNQTLTNANLSQYDSTVSSDEDIFFDVDGSNNLTIPYTGTSSYSDQKLLVLANNIYQPSASGSVISTIPNLIIPTLATLTANANTINLTASTSPFSVVGTFSEGTSTIKYTGSSATNISAITYYNLYLDHAGTTFTAAGSMTVSGVLTIYTGTFDAADKSIILSGSGTPFVKTGTFTPSTSTIFYAGSSATNITGTAYYNLYLNHAGTTFTAANNLTATNVLTVNAGTFDAATKIISLTGSGTPFVVTGTFTPSTSTIKYLAQDSTNVAPTNYYDLETSSASASFTYTLNSGTLAVAHDWVVGNGNEVTINANTNDPTLTVGNDFTINDSAIFVASSSATFSIAGNYANSGTFTHSSGTVTFNKSSGTQTVDSGGTGTGRNFNNLVKSGVSTLQLASNSLRTVGTLAIGADATVNLNNLNLTAVTLANDGTLKLSGSETVAITSMDTDSGTVDYTGAGNYLSLAAGNSYYVLKFSGSGSWKAGADLTAGSINIAAGTFNAADKTITISGSGTPFTITGTFVPSTSTISYTGAADTNIVPTTYYNLRFAPSSGPPTYSFSGNTTVTGALSDTTADSKVTFHAGSTYTIANINLAGTSGHAVLLRSSTSGSQWIFNVGQVNPTATYVDVKDSNASGGSLIDASTGGLNSGNNNNWKFAVASVAINPTSVTLYPAGTAQFSAYAFDSNSEEISGASFTWVVSSGGSISNAGLLTAGSTPGTYSNKISATTSGVVGYTSFIIQAQPPEPTPTPTPTPAPASTSTPTFEETSSDEGTGNSSETNNSHSTADKSAPISVISAPSKITIGETAQINAAGSSDNVGIVSYSWNFGDSNTGSGLQVSHKYSQIGRYNITLTVLDAAGNQAMSSSLIDVVPPPPELTKITTNGTQIIIEGKACPLCEVIITIYSDPYTIKTTADSNGSFKATFDYKEANLAPGEHKIVLVAQEEVEGNLSIGNNSGKIAVASDEKKYDAIINVSDNGKLDVKVKQLERSNLIYRVIAGVVTAVLLIIVLMYLRKRKSKRMPI